MRWIPSPKSVDDLILEDLIQRLWRNPPRTEEDYKKILKAVAEWKKVDFKEVWNYFLERCKDQFVLNDESFRDEHGNLKENEVKHHAFISTFNKFALRIR